jgi:hypothetical protein
MSTSLDPRQLGKRWRPGCPGFHAGKSTGRSFSAQAETINLEDFYLLNIDMGNRAQH